MVIFLLLCVGASSAQAGTIKPEHFFDFDYAVTLWTTKTTIETFDPLFDCYTQNDSAFIAWHTEYRRTPQKALDALETHPHAGAIKRCYDTRLTFQKWGEVYDAWRIGLGVYGGEGWNRNTRAIQCLTIQTLNIFTHQCNDLPDWRTPKNAAEDAERTAMGNARWDKKQKTPPDGQ